MWETSWNIFCQILVSEINGVDRKWKKSNAMGILIKFLNSFNILSRI